MDIFLNLKIIVLDFMPAKSRVFFYSFCLEFNCNIFLIAFKKAEL